MKKKDLSDENNIEKGIYLDIPRCFISWDISRKELETILNPHGLKKYTSSCYEASVVFLKGLECRMVFNFGVFGIKKFSIFTEDVCGSTEDFYNENQRHIESVFGKSTSTKKSNGTSYAIGFDSHEWIIGKRRIAHYVDDQYGEVYIKIT